MQTGSDCGHAVAETGNADGRRATSVRIAQLWSCVCAGAELAVVVGSPTFDAANIREGACVDSTGGDCCDTGSKASHVHWGATIVGRSIAERNSVVPAPALDTGT